jgi:maltooligosyltrehalose trehalohydrolase
VDGLRLDAVHALVDRRAIPLLEELASLSREIEQETGRTKFLVAESDLNDPRIVSPQDRGGDGIHGQWSDDYHHALHVALTGETDGYYADFADPGALAKVLRGGFYHDGTYSSFRGRCHGRPLDPDVVRPTQLVVCSQNHDQVGNRAAGDRPSAVLGYDGLAIAAVLTLASPFTPMLFMGEEYGARTPWQFFTSHPEPELAKATSEGRLREFERMGWDPALVPDPQDPETRLRSILDWSEAETDDGERLLALYRRLIAVRREQPSLWAARLDQTEVAAGQDGEARWIAWDRPGVSVAINLGPGSAEFELPYASGRRVAVSTHEAIRAEGGRLAFPGAGAVVLID